MCARYTIDSDPKTLRSIFNAPKPSDIAEFEITKQVIFPGYAAPIVYFDQGKRHLWMRRWGLLLRGSKDQKSKYATHNARTDKLETSRLYYPPWKQGRRCVIPMSFFVEWKGEKGSKIPYAIKDPTSDLTFAAGIWDRTDEFGPLSFDSFTMFTCEPNPFMTSIHDRMPVLLKKDQVDEWLDPKTTPDKALEMLRPWSGKLVASEIKKK